MATIPIHKFKEITKLYKEGLSVPAIAQKFGITLDAAYYFFRKHKIERRTMSQINLLRFEGRKPTFYVKKKLKPKDELLKQAGTMLYWCEGSQWVGETIVDFANSNPAMVKTFLKFLRQVCRIDESKLRVYIYCHANQEVTKLIEYWSAVTLIPKDQFSKPYVRKDYKPEKEGKMKNGMVHIRYYDKKLLIQIRQWIQDTIKFLG